MTFWEHLDVLRWILVRIIVVWFILAVGFFIAMPYIFDSVILGPCHDNFIFYQFLRKIGEVFHLTGDFFTQQYNIKLQNINLAAPFFVHLTTSFVLSLVVLAPYIIWEVWEFIRPALYVNEERGVKKALLLGTIMFYLGVAVGYFMIYPLTLRFLSTYDLSPDIEILISLNSYIDNFMTLVLCMGLAFELPLVTWILSLMGIITRDTLREYRKHAFVIIVIVAAIITPTGDPFTLMAVSLPLYGLYELSILMIKDKKKDDDDEDEDDDKPTDHNDGGKPSGGAQAQKAITKKPDGPDGGGEAKALPAAEKEAEADKTAAEAGKPSDDKAHEPAKDDDKPISQILREQREEAQRAKNIAKNTALQERMNAAAKAGAAGTAAAAATEAAAAEGTEAAAGTETPALTANTEPSVKESLAAAAATTAKKKREPRMVMIDDQIYFEEYPEDAPDPHEAPAEKAEQQPTEETSAAPEQPGKQAPSVDNQVAEETPAADEQTAPETPAEAEPKDPESSVADEQSTSEASAPVNQPEREASYDVQQPEESSSSGSERPQLAEKPATDEPVQAVSSAPEPSPAPSADSVQTEPSSPEQAAEAPSATAEDAPAQAEPETPAAEPEQPAKPKPRIDFGGIKYDPSRFGGQ